MAQNKKNQKSDQKVAPQEQTLIDITDKAERHEYSNKKVKEISELTLTDVNLEIMLPLNFFINLKELWLNRNLIESLESLTKMQMNLMTKFSVSHNKILTLQSFRKLYIPEIVQLQFDNNQIIETDHFDEFEICNEQTIKVWFNFGSSAIQQKRINLEMTKKFRKWKNVQISS